MKRLEIEVFKQFQKANFYTIRFENDEISETDSFIARFEEDPEHCNDLGIILQWIATMGEEKGTLERYFRPERKAQAIPIVTSGLRLYCIRISDELVILGNGGIKESQKVQNSPTAFPQFKLMNKLAYALERSIAKGKTISNGKDLSGVLKFEI